MNLQSPAGAPSREPKQGRSKASYERMLAAAEKLLIKSGNDDFTLTDVSKAGKVSIGSIYCRFDSKDDLIRAVQTKMIERMDSEYLVMLTKVRAEAAGLDDFMARFVEGFAESLRQFSPLLRPIMMCATRDTTISMTGKSSHDRFARQVRSAMLEYRADFKRDDHERLVASAYRVIYSTLARYLGLGSAMEVSGEGDWNELKEDLGIMCAAYLRTSGRGVQTP